MSDLTVKSDGVLDLSAATITGARFSILDAVCSFCGKHFKNEGTVWHQLCPECRECPECGSTFLVWHARTDDKPEKPYIRCLRCMHGREASNV